MKAVEGIVGIAQLVYLIEMRSIFEKCSHYV